MRLFFKILFILNFVALNILAIWASNYKKVREAFFTVLWIFIAHFMLRLLYKEIKRRKKKRRHIDRIYKEEEEFLSREKLMQRASISKRVLNRNFKHQERYSRSDYLTLLRRID